MLNKYLLKQCREVIGGTMCDWDFYGWAQSQAWPQGKGPAFKRNDEDQTSHAGRHVPTNKGRRTFSSCAPFLLGKKSFLEPLYSISSYFIAWIRSHAHAGLPERLRKQICDLFRLYQDSVNRFWWHGRKEKVQGWLRDCICLIERSEILNGEEEEYRFF